MVVAGVVEAARAGDFAAGRAGLPRVMAVHDFVLAIRAVGRPVPFITNRAG